MKILRTTAKYVLVATLSTGMFLGNVPGGILEVLYQDIRDRNIVDRMWLAEHDAQVIDAFQPKLARAAPLSGATKGVFDASNSVGTQQITGVGFRPKAIIFFWTQEPPDATPATAADQFTFGMGFTSGTNNERGVSFWSTHAATSDTGRISSTTSMIIVQNGVSGAMLREAELTSFDEDGFTINWKDADATQHLIHYLAFNEAVITKAKVGTFSLTTGTGNLSVTDPGFTPQFVMFLSAMTSTHGVNTAEAGIMIGAATGPNNEWAVTLESEDAQGTANTCHAQNATSSIIFLPHDAGGNDCNGVADAAADFTTFTDTGFNINKSNAPAVARDVFYLALAGPNFYVGNLTAPTSVGNQTVSGLTFQPDTLFLAGWGIAASSIAPTLAAEGGISFGAVASSTATTSQGAISAVNDNGDGSPDPDTQSTTTRAYTELENTTPTIGSTARLASMNTNGFTLDWTIVDNTANQILYWAMEGGGEIARPIRLLEGYRLKILEGKRVKVEQR